MLKLSGMVYSDSLDKVLTLKIQCCYYYVKELIHWEK